MKAGIATAVVLAGALASGSAMADNGDGNELIRQCTVAVKAIDGVKVDTYYDVGYCLGLTQGVRQTLRLVDEQLQAKDRTCFPDGITNGQGMRIVLKYLQDHPAQLQETAINLVYLAYSDAYPCK